MTTATPAHVDCYLAAWNETDPTARRRAVAEAFSAEVRYTDPITDVRGADALADTIGAVQAQFPGFVFRLAGPVDAHHDQLRFTWELGPAGVEAPVVGSDVALVDADGRMSLVLGFLDRVPAAT